MAAGPLDSDSQSLPVQHGMLRVAGATNDPESANEAYDVIIDSRSELSVVLLSLESGREGASVYGALAVVREAVLARKPIYEIVGELRSWCAAPENDASIGFTLLRFAQPDARIEILIAGMPGLACAVPGGRVSMHPPLSGPVGGYLGEVHPYELSPLVWGSVWILMSKRLTGGVADADSVHGRVLTHHLLDVGAKLAGLTSEELAPWLPRIAGEELEGDGSLVLVHADPTRRFQSDFR